MKASIIVPSMNRPQDNTGVLRHILAQDVSKGEMELVWVSPYPRPNCATEQRFPITWIETEKVLSAAQARNLGMARAKGDLFLFLDDDMIVGNDFVALHVEKHCQVPGTLVRGIRYELNREYIQVVRHTSELLDVNWLEGKSELSPFEAEAIRILGDVRRSRFSTNWVYCITANFSVRRSSLSDGLLFDEHYAHSGCEDTDMCYRLYCRGMRMEMIPSAKAFHVHDRQDFARKAATLRKNVKYFGSKFKSRPDVQRVVRHMMSLLSDETGMRWLYGSTASE